MNYTPNNFIRQPIFSIVTTSILFLVVVRLIVSNFVINLASVILMLLPIVLSILLDKSSDKCLLLTISFFNIGAIVLSGAKLISTDSVLVTKHVIKYVYMSSATGFIFYLVLPTAIKTFALQRSLFKRARARMKIKQIESSWD